MEASVSVMKEKTPKITAFAVFGNAITFSLCVVRALQMSLPLRAETSPVQTDISMLLMEHHSLSLHSHGRVATVAAFQKRKQEREWDIKALFLLPAPARTHECIQWPETSFLNGLMNIF